MPYCLSCGSMIDEYDSAYYARNMTCISCYSRKAFEAQMISCAKCGVRMRADQAKARKGGSYCNYCTEELERLERRKTCSVCGQPIDSWEKAIPLLKGPSHEACAKRLGTTVLRRCSFCGTETARFRFYPGGKVACQKCDSGVRPRQKVGVRPLISKVFSQIRSILP